VSATCRRHDTSCRQKRKKTTRHKTTLSAKRRVPYRTRVHPSTTTAPQRQNVNSPRQIPTDLCATPTTPTIHAHHRHPPPHHVSLIIITDIVIIIIIRDVIIIIGGIATLANIFAFSCRGHRARSARGGGGTDQLFWQRQRAATLTRQCRPKRLREKMRIGVIVVVVVVDHVRLVSARLDTREQQRQ